MKIKIDKQEIAESLLLTGPLLAGMAVANNRMNTNDAIEKANQAELDELKKDKSFLGSKPSNSYSRMGNIVGGLKYGSILGAGILGLGAAAGDHDDTLSNIKQSVSDFGLGAAGAVATSGIAGSIAHTLLHDGKTYQQTLAERQAELNKGLSR